MSKRIEGTVALANRLSMNNNERAARKWDQAMESLAADVTNTAYAVALAHGARGSWVDLELRLWKALARTVRAWGDPRAEGLAASGSGNGCSQEHAQTEHSRQKQEN